MADRVSTKRSISCRRAFPDRKDPEGHPLCCYCGAELKNANGTWRRGNCRYCSDECSSQVYIRTDPSFARYRVRDRDKGVCAECGLDTDRIRRLLGLRWPFVPDRPSRVGRPMLWRIEVRISKAIRDSLTAAGYVKGSSSHLWEMDHIVPVSEGGGLCGLDGYRTLCHKCHSAETNKLRRRLGRLIRIRNAETRDQRDGQVLLFQ